MRNTISVLGATGLVGLLFTVGCAPDPCTIADNNDGTFTMSCPDGTSASFGDGADGDAWLVSTTAEPAGANCPDGGQAVKVGPDSDGDGQLGDSEVVTTTYVCDGSDGTNGADGTTYLVDVVDEDPGENCANGGISISVGPDSDGDGIPDTEDQFPHQAAEQFDSDNTPGVNIPAIWAV